VAGGDEFAPLVEIAAGDNRIPTISTLFNCVQRPVVVQLVLPVSTRLALPCASLSTTNLLCTLGDDLPGCDRSRCFTSSPADVSCCAPVGRVALPLPRRTWPRLPNGLRASTSSWSFIS